MLRSLLAPVNSSSRVHDSSARDSMRSRSQSPRWWPRRSGTTARRPMSHVCSVRPARTIATSRSSTHRPHASSSPSHWATSSTVSRSAGIHQSSLVRASSTQHHRCSTVTWPASAGVRRRSSAPGRGQSDTDTGGTYNTVPYQRGRSAIEREDRLARHQRLGRCGQLFDADTHARTFDPLVAGDLGETALAEPAPDVRPEVGLLSAARPEDGRPRSAELPRDVDEPLDVGCGDVAHDAAEKDEVGGYETGVGVGGSRIGLDDLEVDAEPGDPVPGGPGVGRVELDERAADPRAVVLPLLENAEDVVALTRARAEHTDVTGSPVEARRDLSLHLAQAS